MASLNMADREVIARIIRERAFCGEEAEWSEIALPAADGSRPNIRRVYTKRRNALMNEAAQELSDLSASWAERIQ